MNMMNDKYTEIANESIRRKMNEYLESMDSQDEAKYDPVQDTISPEAMRRLAALNHVMHKIITTIHMN